MCVNTQLSEVRRNSKEVIQPQVPLGLPCYDFTPVMNHKVVTVPPKVRLATSFATHSHGVTGGVYKARERIHRSNADLRLLAIPTSAGAPNGDGTFTVTSAGGATTLQLTNTVLGHSITISITD